MSKARTKLLKACAKLHYALEDAQYLLADCELPAEELLQEDFDMDVEHYGGDEDKARRNLAKIYKADLKRVMRDLEKLSDAACWVCDALPAVAAEQLAALDKFEYRGEDEE